MKIKVLVMPTEMCDDCALEQICMALRDNQQMGIECPFTAGDIHVTLETPSIPDTPTEWLDLSKEEIIKRKDAVIDQLKRQIQEMDKDVKDKARKCVEEIESRIKEDCQTTTGIAHALAHQEDVDYIRHQFGIEEKKSEE